MKLYLANSLHTLEEVRQYFRAAYQDRFGKDMDISEDVRTYAETGKVPPYVEAYVKKNQRKEVVNISPV